MNSSVNAMFSLLITIYSNDCPQWFDECLNSVLVNQTRLPSEVILVLDGPVPQEIELVFQKYNDLLKERFVVVRISENKGLGNALKIGLEKCSYELVARMDADDLSMPNRFQKQLERFHLDDSLDILGSNANLIDADGTNFGTKFVPEEHDRIYSLLWTCPLIHPSVMFKKSTVLNSGSYASYLRRRQDYELWFRCALRGARFYNIQEPLISYRMTSDTFKKTDFNKAWEQYKIGVKGVRNLNLGIKARVGVAYPLLKSILPVRVRQRLHSVIGSFDPRGSR